ncbi:GNAT family N-acetyltransferase [Microlunatus speluncae]|uniref:GNAT family N-acetyltransferase n=1 Tax=Microlunatus speluncae TaxID=2594267 RepID=UPI0012667929|nr:GNAT family N-acetyltransferase [Microlunatus speluncae]
MPESESHALAAEMDLLWGADDHGRPAGPPLAAVGVGSRADELPSGFGLIMETLGRRRPVMITSCLSYLISPGSPRPVPPDLELHTSTEPPTAALRGLRPDPEWPVDEWDDLLGGRLGPWAIAVGPERIVALATTPRDRLGTAEVGVWTHPEHRGRRYAELVVGAWAAVAGRTRNLLFYSHFDDNPASAAVARKLGARPIGRIWQLRNVDSSAADLAPGQDH